jgi:tape measure domain
LAEKEVKVIVSGDSSGADNALKKAAKAATDLGESTEKAGKQTETNLDKINTSAQKAAGGIGNLNTAFTGLKAAVAIGAIGSVIKSITDSGTEAIMAAAKMKQYEIAFTTMLKSAESGKAMMQDLQDFAAKTPFDVPGVVEAAQQLTAFGFEAKDIIPTLTTLGDAAAGLGRGSEGVKLMGYALGQIKAAGTLKTQDVNQLVNAGVSVWQMLADASGKSVAEIKDMTEKGMIDSLAAIEVITKGMQDNYGGMMAATGKEVTGLVNEISEGMGNGLALIGSYLTDSLGIKDVLKTVADSISDMSNAFRLAKDAGKSFGEALLTAVPAPVLIIIGTLASLIGATLVGAIAVAVTAIGALLAPVAGTVIAIAAVGTAISALLVTSETARNILSAVFEDVETKISTVVEVVSDLANIFMDSSKTLGERFFEAIGYVAGLFDSLADNVWEAMGKALDNVEEFVSDSVDSFADFITGGADMGDDFVEMMGNVAERAVTDITNWFSGLPAKIEGIFNSIKAGFDISANNGKLGIQGWAGSSGNSDDYDLMNENFNIYSGQRESASKKGTFDLSGGGGSDKGGTGGLNKTEREVSRINEAVAKAIEETATLQSKFDSLHLDINFEGTSGSERVFAQIDREKTARLQNITDVLKSEENAVKEAQKLRESAEKTGDADAIANAKALYDERNTLYQNSLNEASSMREEVEQQAYNKSLTLETQLQAAKAEAERAMQEMSLENFIAYLDSKDAEQYARLQTEQDYRQQMFEWEMESQQTLLDFAFKAAETMKNQLASGIASVITEGASFGKMLANLGKQILNMFIQWVVGRTLAAVCERALGKLALAETQSLAKATALAWEPAAALAEAAAPGSIARGKIAAAAVVASGSFSSSTDIFNGKEIKISGGGSTDVFNGKSTDTSSLFSIEDSVAGTIPSGSASGSGVISTNSFADSGLTISGGSSVSVINNNYGDINNGSDLDDLMDGFSGAVLSAARGA